jgi:VanZ family protein
MKIFTSKWPAILWSVIIFIALVVSAQGLEHEKVKLFPQADKVIHFILFGVFTLLWLTYLEHAGYINKHRHFAFILTISIAYGVGMEFVQMLPIVSRDFSIGDMIADAAGSSAALWWHMKKPR